MSTTKPFEQIPDAELDSVVGGATTASPLWCWDGPLYECATPMVYTGLEAIGGAIAGAGG